MSHVDKVAAAIKGVLSHADYKRGNLVEMQGALPACSDLLANAKILRAVLPLQVVPSAEEGCNIFSKVTPVKIIMILRTSEQW